VTISELAAFDLQIFC